MSVRLQNLLDAVDAITKIEPSVMPDADAEQALLNLRDAWEHLPADKLMRLIRFIEGWADTKSTDGYEVAYNLLLAWHSYKDATT